MTSATANWMLGNSEDANTDFLKSLQIYSDNSSILHSYAQYLNSQNRISDAVIYARRAYEIGSEVTHGFTLAILLSSTEDDSETDEAIEILEQIVNEQSTLIRLDALQLLCEILASRGKSSRANEIIDSLQLDELGSAVVDILRARLNTETDLDIAKELALSAFEKEKTLTLSPNAIRLLATVLMQVSEYEKALTLWKKIVVPGQVDIDLRNLVRSAYEVGDHAVIMEIARQAREKGVFDSWLIENETRILANYAPNKAIEVLEDQLKKNPNDKSARLQLSLLGVELNNSDIISTDLSLLPTPKESSSEQALYMVSLLRSQSLHNEAVEYAYAFLRENFSDHLAHRAYIMAVGPWHEQDPEIKVSDTAQEGFAVGYKENNDSTPKWLIVVADDEIPKAELNEISLEDAKNRGLIGKKVGEEFTLGESPIQPRTAEITGILHRFAYRFQDSMSSWQTRFPEDPLIQMFKLPDKEKLTKEDLEPFFKAIDLKQFDSEQKEEQYKNSLMPLALFSQSVGRDIYRTQRYIVSSSDLPIRCSTGTSEEREMALDSLRQAKFVVLDITALITLQLLGGLDLLERWPFGRLKMSSSGIRELNQILQEATTREHGVVSKEGASYINEDITEEALVKYKEGIKRLVDAVNKVCVIEDCVELASLESKTRELLINSLGHHGADALILSKQEGHVLWSDDLAMSLLGNNEFGVSYVWTQVMYQAMVEENIIDLETYSNTTARLAGWNYEFTSLNVNALIAAARLAEWKHNDFPLAKNIELFANQSIDNEQVVALALGFIIRIFQERILEEYKKSILISTLAQLNTRGEIAVKALEYGLPNAFGLDAVNAAKAKEIIQEWHAIHS